MATLRKYRRALIVAAVAGVVLAAVLLILLWPRFTPPIKVVFGPFQAGHYGDMYDDHFCLAFVTNVSNKPIALHGGFISYSFSNGKVINNTVMLWEGKSADFIFAPNQTVHLPVPVDKKAISYRITFDYLGPQPPRGIVEACVNKLPPKLVPPGVTRWLRNRGLLRQPLDRGYVSPWMTNAPVQASIRG